MLTEGHRKLRAWLKKKEPGHSQIALAAQLGVNQSAVSLWIKVGHRPSDARRKGIEIVTGIPAEDWLTKKERALLERLSRPADPSAAAEPKVA